jgi:hypothetical protein
VKFFGWLPDYSHRPGRGRGRAGPQSPPARPARVRLQPDRNIPAQFAADICASAGRQDHRHRPTAWSAGCWRRPASRAGAGRSSTTCGSCWWTRGCCSSRGITSATRTWATGTGTSTPAGRGCGSRSRVHTHHTVSIHYLSVGFTPLDSTGDHWLDFVMEGRRLACDRQYRERLRQLRTGFSRAA